MFIYLFVATQALSHYVAMTPIIHTHLYIMACLKHARCNYEDIVILDWFMRIYLGEFMKSIKSVWDNALYALLVRRIIQNFLSVVIVIFVNTILFLDDQTAN